MTVSLDKIGVGECARVREMCETGSMRRRFLDIGLIENTDIECVGANPCGDPLAFMIRGSVIAIRRENCRKIFVERI